MEKFTQHTGVGVPLRRSNVDTDQIIPAVYLKRVTRTGFEDALFAAWRGDPEFVLNQPAYSAGSVLVAGPDFGTGSSREHAVWALKDYGFRVVLSSRFADIFRGNSGKQGLLAAVVAPEDIELIWKVLETRPGTEVTVDLVGRTVVCDDVVVPFAGRRLHALAPHGGPGRHRPDAQPRAGDPRVRGAPRGVAAEDAARQAPAERRDRGRPPGPGARAHRHAADRGRPAVLTPAIRATTPHPVPAPAATGCVRVRARARAGRRPLGPV